MRWSFFGTMLSKQTVVMVIALSPPVKAPHLYCQFTPPVFWFTISSSGMEEKKNFSGSFLCCCNLDNNNAKSKEYFFYLRLLDYISSLEKKQERTLAVSFVVFVDLTESFSARVLLAAPGSRHIAHQFSSVFKGSLIIQEPLLQINYVIKTVIVGFLRRSLTWLCVLRRCIHRRESEEMFLFLVLALLLHAHYALATLLPACICNTN